MVKKDDSNWKLPDFMELTGFKWLRQQMHIPRDYPVDFSVDVGLTERDWDDILLKGLEITSDDEDFEILDDGFAYQGRRVLVYIRDQLAQYRDQNSGYRYHLTWCRTLESMNNRGRFKKYVVSTNTDGYFQINYVSDSRVVEKTVEPLHVCKNCLSTLNWKGYQGRSWPEKDRIFEEFDLEEFFAAHADDNLNEFHIVPDASDISAPPNVYPKDWAVISKQYKRWQNMTCKRCGRHFKSLSELHVHHRNGVKSDYRPSNLEVLCPNCHQIEHPDHKIFGSTNFGYDAWHDHYMK